GTTINANDSTSGGHHGTAFNAPPAVAGQFNGGASFTTNANVQRIVMPESTEPTSATAASATHCGSRNPWAAAAAASCATATTRVTVQKFASGRLRTPAT